MSVKHAILMLLGGGALCGGAIAAVWFWKRYQQNKAAEEGEAEEGAEAASEESPAADVGEAGEDFAEPSTEEARPAPEKPSSDVLADLIAFMAKEEEEAEKAGEEEAEALKQSAEEAEAAEADDAGGAPARAESSEQPEAADSGPAEQADAAEQAPAAERAPAEQADAEEQADTAEQSAPTPLVAKNRRRRYKIGKGDLIELRPGNLPEGAFLKPSRNEVKVELLHFDGDRTVVKLDGPSGKVNLAVLADKKGKGKRPVMSWKFQLVDREAA